MDIVLALPGVDQMVSLEACERLGVIYPELGFKVTETGITITGDTIPDPVHLKQSVLDQIIRSKNDAKTAPLRQLLYNRLLR